MPKGETIHPRRPQSQAHNSPWGGQGPSMIGKPSSNTQATALPPVASTPRPLIASMRDLPPPSQWTSTWTDHFKSLNKLQFRDYTLSFYQELQQQQRLGEGQEPLAVNILMDKMAALCRFLLKHNPTVVLDIIDNNLITGDKCGEKELQEVYHKVACATPLHLMTDGAIPQIQAALCVHEGKLKELEAEKVALRSQLECLWKNDQTMGRGWLKPEESVEVQVESAESVCCSNKMRRRGELLEQGEVNQQEPSSSRGRPAPTSLPAFTGNAFNSQGQPQQDLINAQTDAAVGSRPPLPLPQMRMAPLSADVFSPQEAPRANPPPLHRGGWSDGHPLHQGLLGFMSLEQILDRLEEIFQKETQERSVLTLVVTHVFSSPIAIANILMASFPHVLDTSRLIKVFLEELEKPMVMMQAMQQVPHIFLSPSPPMPAYAMPRDVIGWYGPRPS